MDAKLAEDVKSIISGSSRGYATESELINKLRGGRSAMRGWAPGPASGRRWTISRWFNLLHEIENDELEQFAVEVIRQRGGGAERRITINAK